MNGPQIEVTIATSIFFSVESIYEQFILIKTSFASHYIHGFTIVLKKEDLSEKNYDTYSEVNKFLFVDDPPFC